MARNALIPALLPFQLPTGPDAGNFLNPLMAGIQRADRLSQQAVENNQNQERLGLAKNADARAGEAQRMARERAEVERLGKLAQVINDDPNDVTASQRWQGVIQGNPQMGGLLQKYGVDPRDHRTGAKFLMAEVGSYKSQSDLETERLKRDQTRAQTEVSRAQAALYRSRAGAMTAQGQPAPAASADPLQGAGMDDDGNIVLPRAGQSSVYGYGDGAESFGLPAYQQQRIMPPPMRLGGPRDDIDASMRLDEGRAVSRGTQIAQATSSGYVPVSQMDQARARMFGQTGVTSPEIPGIVTDAGRNRRMDVPATREAQGQRAFDSASTEQQARLTKFRQDQELWTGVYKRAPRAGYYYGADGREMALTDKNFKGDRESQATALLNLKKIEAAGDVLIGKRQLGPDGKSTRDSSGASYPVRAVAGQLNIGDTGQAFVDMKQSAMGIAYALSGKTVAVAEMKNFMDAYGPTPLDSADRIETKISRLKDFYNTLITASRGGESYEQAFAKATASMGIKNPDGSAMGQPAVAERTGAPPPPDLSKLTTEELVRRLGGGR
jgi:hypothetical protein